MLELFKIGARLALDKGDFDRGVSDADQSGKGLAESLEKSIDKVKNFLKNSAIVALAVKGAQAVWNLAKSTSEVGDRIDKQSQALGFSRKAYQEWAYILRQSGASIDDMGMAMKTMQEVIAGNSAEAAAGLSKLGLSAAHLQSLSPEDQFETLVKAFQQMPEGAEKSRLAMQLFGRNAQSLMPLLNSSADELDGLRQRAHDLGLIMSDEDVDASVAFGDALDDLNAVWGALKQKFGAQLLPGFTKGLITLANSLGRISNALTKAFKEGDWKGLFSTITEEISALLPQAIDAISGMILGLFENADKIIDLGISLVNGLVDGIAKAAPALIAKLPQILSKMWESFKDIGKKLGNVLIDAINAIFGTNIPHIDEIKWPTWPEVQRAAAEAWEGIQEGLASLATTLGKFIFGERDDGSIDWPTWDEVQAAAQAAWEGIVTGLNGLVQSIGKFIFGERDDGSVDWPTWDEVAAAAREALQGIVDGLSGLITSVGKFIFGERDDGSVDWPTWTDIGSAAHEAYVGIFDGVKSLATTVGKFIFGERDDGSIDWPTWDEIASTAQAAWQGIVDGLAGYVSMLGSFVFGVRDDGATVNWPTWDEISSAVQTAWQGIIDGLTGFATSLGAFVFGTRDDGSVDWPTWEDVGNFAQTAWQGIKDGLATLAGSVGAFVFGTLDDGSVDWPTWEDVGTAASNAWQGIKDGLASLAVSIGKFIFGTRDDGAIDWPTWDKISKAATDWWSGEDGILSKLAGIFKATFGIDPPDVLQEIKDWWFGTGEGGDNGVRGQIADFLKSTFGIDLPDTAEIVSRLNNWWNNTVLPLLTFGLVQPGGNSEWEGWETEGPPEGWDGTYSFGDDGKLQYNAKGLNYVPYDGYRTVLHRGEAVLNASQGREWRQNGGSGLDMRQLYESVASAVAAAVSGIAINMDGKAVGNAVTEQVSRNLYLNQLGRRFATP